MPIVIRRPRPRSTSASFSTSASTPAPGKKSFPLPPSGLTTDALSLLAAQLPSYSTRAYLVTWRRQPRIIQLRSNCLLVFRRAPDADLANVDHIIVLSPRHHPHAVGSHVVKVDNDHSFYFHHPRHATAFRAALLSITELPPNQYRYALLASVGKGCTATVYAARRVLDGQGAQQPLMLHQGPSNHQHFDTRLSTNVTMDGNGSASSQTNSEGSDIIYNSDGSASGGGSTKINNAYSTSKTDVKKLILRHKHDTHDGDDVYAVKIIPKSHVSGIDGNASTAHRRLVLERLALQRAVDLQSPFIIRLVDAFETPRHFHIVTDLAHYGSLHRLLMCRQQHHNPTPKRPRSKRLSEDAIRHIFAEMVCALHDVHSAGFLYRDMKPSNILITSTGHVKLGDFGLAKPVDVEHDLLSNIWGGGGRMRVVGRALSFVGTRRYMAPEQIAAESGSQEGYGSAADIWGLGVTLFYLLVGRHPFASLVEDGELEDGELEDGELEGEEVNRLNWCISHERVTVPIDCDMCENAMDLLHGMLHRDEGSRIDIYGIMAHPWLCDMDWGRLRSHARENCAVDCVVRCIEGMGISTLKIDVGKDVYDDDGSFKEMVHKQQKMQKMMAAADNSKNGGDHGGGSGQDVVALSTWTGSTWTGGQVDRLLGFDFVR